MASQITKDQSFFDPQVYLDRYFDQPDKDEFFLVKLTNFWTQVVKEKATRMLEYGAGPTISRFITASNHVQSIIAAEYLPANRQAMKDWINQDPKAFNWRLTFEYVVQKLEGLSHEEVDKREAKVRDKIKAVIHCDIKAQNHLETPKEISAKCGPPFDVVQTSLCLEATVDSFEEYKDQVTYLAGLVRPGGYLRMQGVLEQTFYTVNEKLYTFYLTKEMVLESMKEAGITNVVIELATEHLNVNEFNALPFADLKDMFVAYGQK